MRLLVTGSGGFLGRNALLHLPTTWQIAALHRPEDTSFREFLQAQALDHITPIACDLTDLSQVQQAAREIGRDWESCLYLASNTSIPLSIQQPAFDLTTNTIGLINVLETCSFEHLVYFSSGAVYIGASGLVGVDTPVTPTLPYAVSKLASEHYVRAFALHRGSPRQATIVRFFGAFGPYEPSRKVYTKLVRRFALERNPSFTITGDGGNYIDAMYIDDAIRALQLILQAPPGGVLTVDLGVGAGETIKGLVMRAGHVFGLEPELQYTGESPEYILYHIDPALFAQRYNFWPEVSIEEGFQRLAAHLREVDDRASGE